MNSNVRAIHQSLAGASPGSSIWNEAVCLRDALRTWGFRSNIYVEEVHTDLRREVMHFTEYRPQLHDVLIYHYSTGSPLTKRMLATNCPFILFYHNITPTQYLEHANPRMAAQLDHGRDELKHLAKSVCLAVAHSEFSRHDLLAAGFEHTVTLPVLVPDTLSTIQPDSDTIARFDDGWTNLLSVGRLAPNKRHEDAIKTLYAYRRINPNARLLLVGTSQNLERYVEWLHGFTRSLNLSEFVIFCGHVSDAELAAYYRLANVLLSMSEHEGFCIPLVEAMRLAVPVVAYRSSAIPETLGGAGVLIRSKNYAVIAELLEQLRTHESFRKQIVSLQSRRAAELDQSVVLDQMKPLIYSALERAA